MKTGKFSMSEIKSFEDFSEVWANMRDATPEETEEVRRKIAEIRRKPLLFEEIYLGQKVQDKSGTKGKITDIFDEHNINVTFDQGGAGLYCFVENCDEGMFEPLYRQI